MSGDAWLVKYNACSRVGQELMEMVNERNRLPKTSANHAKLSSQIRQTMKRYSDDVSKLRQDLIRSSSSYNITQRESDRRQAMLDDLATKERHLEDAISGKMQSTRSDLLSGPLGGGAGSSGWRDDDEDDDTRMMSNNELRQTQQRIIREQDAGLDALANVVARQKDMAITIGGEVDTQNEIIDDIHDHVDRTNERLIKETRHITIVDRKSTTCWYWMVIILLFVAIVVVLVVPYGDKK